MNRTDWAVIWRSERGPAPGGGSAHSGRPRVAGSRGNFGVVSGGWTRVRLCESTCGDRQEQERKRLPINQREQGSGSINGPSKRPRGAADSARRVAYRCLFRAHLDPVTISDLRLPLNQGQPWGNERFYAEMERMTGNGARRGPRAGRG